MNTTNRPKKLDTGVRGRSWTNVRALAREHTAEAVAKLAELVENENSCVAYVASRTLLEFGHGKAPFTYQEAQGKTSKHKQPSNVTVKIAQFGKEKLNAG